MPSLENPGLILPMVARAKAVSALAGYAGAGEQWLRDARAPERALRIFSKAGVPASSTLDSDLDSAVAIGSYTETLRSASAAVRAVSDGLVRRVPFFQKLSLVTSAPSAAIVDEGQSIPVSRVVLGGEVVTPRKVSALLVLTAEMLRDTGAAAEMLFNKELRSALGAAIDAAFFNQLVGSGTDAPSVPSSGPSPSDVLLDLRSAMMQTNALGQPQLFFVLGSDAAKMAASLASNGIPVFQDMSPTGGSMLNVLTAVSSGIAPDEAYLVEGSCVAANIGDISVLSSRSADVEMSDAPAHDSTTPTPAQLVSMFGTNSVAIRGTADFGAVALRSNAVVRIENIAWGGT